MISASAGTIHMFSPLTTQIVGSYTKPAWLLSHRDIYRYDKEPWKISPEYLSSAQDDVARLAIFDQERAGLDIVTDGEACQSARNVDPVSASNLHPPVDDQRLACPALAGVAKGRPSAADGYLRL